MCRQYPQLTGKRHATKDDDGNGSSFGLVPGDAPFEPLSLPLRE